MSFAFTSRRARTSGSKHSAGFGVLPSSVHAFTTQREPSLCNVLRRRQTSLAGVQMPASHLRRRMHPVVRRHETGVSNGPRVLGARSIALISLAAVLTLRGMPTVAEYGWSSIAFYVLGALFFFIRWRSSRRSWRPAGPEQAVCTPGSSRRSGSVRVPCGVV